MNVNVMCWCVCLCLGAHILPYCRVDARAMVDSVHSRRSRLVDPPVANVDHALLVFALERPPLEAKQLTRFLVSMEATGVPFTLVLNKCDLVDETTRADWEARLEQWGYRPRFVSVATGEGVDELEAELAQGMKSDRMEEEEEEEEEWGDDRGEVAAAAAEEGDEAAEAEGQAAGPIARDGGVTVLAGPSGVGKSSLINRLRAGSKLAEALAEAGEMDLDGSAARDCDINDIDGDEAEAEEEDEDEDRAVYITDVDISGGGGGARGAVTVKGLELQSVKSVSAKLGRGRHTTRHVTLLPLRSGGLLADSPGFGYPSLESLTVVELGECFPEIRRARRMGGPCKFANCTHRDEPGCAIDEVMPWEEERYDQYADLYDEVEAMERAEREAGYKRESRVRYKSGKNAAAAAANAAGGGASATTGARGRGRGEGKGGVAGARGARARGERKKRSGGGKRGGKDAAEEDPADGGLLRGVTRAPPKVHGVQRMEAKLETKSHRRQSRRSRNMETDAMGMEEDMMDMDVGVFSYYEEDDEDDEEEVDDDGYYYSCGHEDDADEHEHEQDQTPRKRRQK